MTRSSSLTEHRPRLEPWASQGVGPGPLSPLQRDDTARLLAVAGSRRAAKNA